jgi:hypothetical protein
MLIRQPAVFLVFYRFKPMNKEEKEKSKDE